MELPDTGEAPWTMWIYAEDEPRFQLTFEANADGIRCDLTPMSLDGSEEPTVNVLSRP